MKLKIKLLSPHLESVRKLWAPRRVVIVRNPLVFRRLGEHPELVIVILRRDQGGDQGEHSAHRRQGHGQCAIAEYDYLSYLICRCHLWKGLSMSVLIKSS